MVTSKLAPITSFGPRSFQCLYIQTVLNFLNNIVLISHNMYEIATTIFFKYKILEIAMFAKYYV